MEKDLPKEPVPLMKPGEVAAALRVDPKTVTRWAAAGLLPSIRTPGGHRRFPAHIVRAMLTGEYDARTNARPKPTTLSPDQVRRLRKEYDSGNYTVAGLAAKYNIGIAALYHHVGALNGLDQSGEA